MGPLESSHQHGPPLLGRVRVPARSPTSSLVCSPPTPSVPSAAAPVVPCRRPTLAQGAGSTEGLPGCWAVLFQRAVVVDPVGCASLLAHHAETAVAFRLHEALGTQHERYFGAAMPTAHSLACLRIGDRVAARAARLAPGVGGLTLHRTGFAPVGRQTKFRESPHHHSPSTSLAWSHRAPSPRALGTTERQAVLDVLHSERFVDQSPAEVHATLLEEQTYLCSPRTMYRVLAAADEVRERRAQARHPVYTKPELVATGPNQVWSWDITKLKGPIPYLYYSLYVILDLFSRYVVGWMVALHENAHLAERLIEQTCAKQGIAPHQLTIHADRGAPMRSKLVALLFSDLGVDASHSRPRVSNDNPFSEAQFRTLKYRPAFPDRFGSLTHARAVSRDLFAWYNDAHHHSGLTYLTPAAVHYDRAATVLAVRHRTRLAAYAAHPERFVQGPPRPETLPTAVWINRPPKSTREDAPGATIVTPDDPQHGVIRRSQPISGDRSITLVTSVESLQ